MSNTFKVGDLVYVPSVDNKVREVMSDSDKTYPLRVQGTTYRPDGVLLPRQSVPSLVHATQENCEALTKLYGVAFEKPKKILKGNALACHLLAQGHKCVLCEVADHKGRTLHRFIKRQDGSFLDTEGVWWAFANPVTFDPVLGFQEMTLEV